MIICTVLCACGAQHCANRYINPAQYPHTFKKTFKPIAARPTSAPAADHWRGG
ncbi:MAG: hypothetical protein JSS78_10570 [Bacteroidetes bacterium]|nr:hypothetical protein [Bacteroidota bacterium]